ncbi:DUF1579 domain-containing protein [Roseiterribacter gracilis]|uniref:DUF1579 domain-containing protein n=1 Tax=Roseiterribacter gracilis TaxID=2812848 RepID=A0A8S8XH83_9PROT|nr:hypothetical protein TMPK1_41410 [Rhodospirillales bacterium TMPK1]
MTSAALAIDASHDFDFFTGTWNVQNRKLKKRLANNDEWESFSSVSHARLLAGGLGHMDEMDLPNGAHGMTIRLFDPTRQLWTLHWVSTLNPVMDPSPVAGRFNGSVGEFFCDDTFEGKKIRVRYTWTVHDRNNVQWAQAFSPDGGTNWETNWIMVFARA